MVDSETGNSEKACSIGALWSIAGRPFKYEDVSHLMASGKIPISKALRAFINEFVGWPTDVSSLNYYHADKLREGIEKHESRIEIPLFDDPEWPECWGGPECCPLRRHERYVAEIEHSLNRDDLSEEEKAFFKLASMITEDNLVSEVEATELIKFLRSVSGRSTPLLGRIQGFIESNVLDSEGCVTRPWLLDSLISASLNKLHGGASVETIAIPRKPSVQTIASNRQRKVVKFFNGGNSADLSGIDDLTIIRMARKLVLSRAEEWDRYTYLTKDVGWESDVLRDYDPIELKNIKVPWTWSFEKQRLKREINQQG